MARIVIRTRLLIFLLFLWTLSANDLSAGSQKTENLRFHFDQAARFYEEGQYDAAISSYSDLLKQDLESGPLYYNLGNCFLKKGQLGRAILFYERAKRLEPSDSDLNYNYRHVKSLLGENRQESPTLSQPLEFLRSLSIDGLTVLLSLIYFLSTCILILGIYSPVFKRLLKALLPVLFLIFALCTFILSQKVSLQDREAIILVKRAEAKFQPFERAPTHFILEEGTLIEILRTSGGWVKVKRRDREVGWVKASSLERI